jgi:hypothetical protein
LQHIEILILIKNIVKGTFSFGKSALFASKMQIHLQINAFITRYQQIWLYAQGLMPKAQRAPLGIAFGNHQFFEKN